MKAYINDLVTLLNTKSPTGHSEEAIRAVKARFDELGLVTQLTHKGALIATLEGENTQEALTLSAHIDTLGCVVKEITSDGYLKLSQIGGYAWTTIEGEHVSIETVDGVFYSGQIITNVASSHVHGSKTNSTERNEQSLRVRIDEKVFTKQDVLDLGIEVGDFVHLDPRTTVTPSGFIKSRHLDDKACVIACFEIAKHFTSTNTKPKHTTHFFISNYEEVGHGASSRIPSDTVELLALDMSAPGSGQTSDEYSVTICAKDSTGPYDYGMKKRLIALCKAHDIPYKVDIYPFYGSDGSAAQRAGHDVRVGLIGPGVDASHSYERTHTEAIESTIRLGIAYLETGF
ncbi:aminopeptidase [Erysipelothrix larvae]|uniref:Aminopeptidase n=1 Tax=Erysipelothrix larvae TaxID=1514105 RepID=A0A0X8H2H1_9FIRM|nr:M42 family metallopeptidase [Erysipelothrix larvae]AMC94649.1 aminopeptidase [Erysipelothrix larvae]